jgi:hypothetical protein
VPANTITVEAKLLTNFRLSSTLMHAHTDKGIPLPGMAGVHLYVARLREARENG